METVSESNKWLVLRHLEGQERRIRLQDMRSAMTGDNPGEMVAAFERWKQVRTMRAELDGDIETLEAMGYSPCSLRAKM